jgi:hypothetical protein
MMQHVSTDDRRDMATSVQLDITWDGPVAGVAEHRLSLTAFGPALEKLLTAAKRIASNTVTKAAEPSETGRLAKLAHGIDIQIAGVVGNSTGVQGLLTFDAPANYQDRLFFSLPERTGLELLEAIESENAGESRNLAVRNFLRALPPGLKRQRYLLHENGRVIKDLDLGAVKVPDGMLSLPYLQEIVGMVTGVGFDPGRNEVRVRTEDTANFTAMATERQVNSALELRHEKIRALFLHSEVIGNKLLTLVTEESERPTFSDDEYIFEKWGRTFQELA